MDAVLQDAASHPMPPWPPAGFGKQQVTIRPAATWNFLLPDRPTGQAIRALIWPGPDQASAAIPTFLRVLPPLQLLNDTNG
jgi:hypothetical protein